MLIKNQYNVEKVSKFMTKIERLLKMLLMFTFKTTISFPYILSIFNLHQNIIKFHLKTNKSNML